MAKKDLNQLAKFITDIATGEVTMILNQALQGAGVVWLVEKRVQTA